MTERNGQAVIKVRDQGPGIPEGDLQTVFEPFKRGARGTNNGFGLGLAIAKKGRGRHGGAIIAANRPEGGLSVAIRLRQPSGLTDSDRADGACWERKDRLERECSSARSSIIRYAT